MSTIRWEFDLQLAKSKLIIVEKNYKNIREKRHDNCIEQVLEINEKKKDKSQEIYIELEQRFREREC